MISAVAAIRGARSPAAVGKSQAPPRTRRHPRAEKKATKRGVVGRAGQPERVSSRASAIKAARLEGGTQCDEAQRQHRREETHLLHFLYAHLQEQAAKVWRSDSPTLGVGGRDCWTPGPMAGVGVRPSTAAVKIFRKPVANLLMGMAGYCLDIREIKPSLRLSCSNVHSQTDYCTQTSKKDLLPRSLRSLRRPLPSHLLPRSSVLAIMQKNASPGLSSSYFFSFSSYPTPRQQR